MLDNGPLAVRCRVKSYFGSSVLTQEITLYRDRPDILVEAAVDWREDHCMLKLSFPLEQENCTVWREIPYGAEAES